MKFVSTLSPNCWLAFVPTVCRKWSCKRKFMHRPWVACACCTQTRHSCALPSPPSVYFSSAFEHIPSCRGGGLLRKPVFFATRRGMYVATFYISYLQLKTWSKRIHNRLGCGIYTLEFPPLLECLKGVTTTALELFLTLNILNALPLS